MFIMLIITTIITLSLVLQMKEVPAAENNPYYQENKTETCSVNSLLYSGPQCSPSRCACGFQNLVWTPAYGGHNLSPPGLKFE